MNLFTDEQCKYIVEQLPRDFLRAILYIPNRIKTNHFRVMQAFEPLSENSPYRLAINQEIASRGGIIQFLKSTTSDALVVWDNLIRRDFGSKISTGVPSNKAVNILINSYQQKKEFVSASLAERYLTYSKYEDIDLYLYWKVFRAAFINTIFQCDAACTAFKSCILNSELMTSENLVTRDDLLGEWDSAINFLVKYIPSNPSYNTALMQAISSNDDKMVSLLLQYGADVDAKPELSTRSALSLAIIGKNINIINLLLEYNPTPLYNSEFHNVDYFQRALESQQIELVRYFILNRLDTDEKSYGDKSALMRTALVGDMLSVKLLINAGANIMHTDSEGKRASDYVEETHTLLRDFLLTQERLQPEVVRRSEHKHKYKPG